MFKCQKPIIMCFVLPDQCFQTGISDWHFLSEDKSDENFLSENTSVKKKCQKIQIKLCQWCFLSPNPLTTYLSLKVCVWHSYNLGWELCMYSELGEGSRRESITRPQIPICPVWQLNPLSLNKPPQLQHKWPMFWGAGNLLTFSFESLIQKHKSGQWMAFIFSFSFNEKTIRIRE